MNELNHTGPESSGENRKLPFRVPKNYFDDFSARLQSQLHAEEEATPSRRKNVVRYLKPVLGLAASFTIIFMLVYWPLNSFLPDYLARTNTTIEQNTETEEFIPLIEYIDENSFFTFLVESVTGTEETNEEFNDDELLTYISANVSTYELYLQSEN